MEQDVFNCKGMVERGLNANHLMIADLSRDLKVDGKPMKDIVFTLNEQINFLQSQIYGLQNQVFEYEASVAWRQGSSAMKGGVVDDLRVMFTRKESSTCLARSVMLLVSFAVGVIAGLWTATGPRTQYTGPRTQYTGPRTQYTGPRTQYTGPRTQYTGPRTHWPARPPGRAEAEAGVAEFVAPTRLMHDMTDDQLFWRASMVPVAAEYPFKRVPKVAFTFRTGRGELPLAPLWERFFRGNEDRFSVYVHAPPGMTVNVSADSPFYGRQIPSQHYLPTTVNMLHGARNANRTVTYVDWSKGGAHPAKYTAENVTAAAIQGIRRRRWRSDRPCYYNQRPTSMCFLFARKFAPDTLGPLLNMSSAVMGY
ncbi:hypothetical protein TRIUR3_18883 [Triticum urartu]|uniref:Uncharacterized protein n=1 Tax=Triticum urartu TaxID=4572 RepID=M8ALT4_TRIUA|nr:hypothetical protein TRIUR3_18883 [Triticum urartu]